MVHSSGCDGGMNSCCRQKWPKDERTVVQPGVQIVYYNLATVDACHALGSCMLNKDVLSPYTVKPKIAVKIKRGNQELKYNVVLLSHLPRESQLL